MPITGPIIAARRWLARTATAARVILAWADASAIPPWEWRAHQRAATAE